MPSPAGTARDGSPPAPPSQADVLGALRDGALRVHYQQIVSLDTGRARGVEALLRWEHPRGGMLFPDDFLPAVAHTPVMHDITRWVIRTALMAAREWPGWTVSVNVSARDVTRTQLVRDVDDALHASEVAPERLVLELTEQAVVSNLDTALSVLGSLRERGVGLSLDDFGTGYSSLLYLRDLPITELKIDRTFLSRTPDSEEDLAIVRSVAKLGRFMGLDVVAEGVETVEQAQLARTARCTAAQGFLWGVPAPAEQLDPDAVVLLPEIALTSSHASRSQGALAVSRVRELLTQGASLHTIAAALNSTGLRTARQTRWTAASVAMVIADLPDKPTDLGYDGPEPR